MNIKTCLSRNQLQRTPPGLDGRTSVKLGLYNKSLVIVKQAYKKLTLHQLQADLLRLLE